MRISKTTNHGNTRWRVTDTIEGNRRQRFFLSREDARDWMKSIEGAHNGFWGKRTAEEQRDIISAYNLVSKKGLSIYGCLLDSPTRLNLNPLPISDAARQYIEVIDKRSLRPASLQQTQLQLSQLSKEFGSVLCHCLTPTHLERWFTKRKWARSTIDGVIAKIGPFFTWCVREKFAHKNPCAEIRRPKAEDTGPPGIFSFKDAGTLLAEALRIDPPVARYFAIGLFSGIRPNEIQRLNNGDISDRYIQVSGSSSKTRKRRLVTVLPNLIKWLGVSDGLPSKNRRKRTTKVIEAAGLNWAHDIMRHSYASYHLAQFESADKTALEMGHRDTQMLFRHYRELVTKEDAECYWQIIPT